MKRAFLTVLFIVLFVPLVYAAEYLGSKKSDKYHYTSCRWAQKIKPENIRVFASASEAVLAGYVPCKVCKPPLRDKDN